MASSNKTRYYNLPQWLRTDKPSFTTDLNQAFATIDTEVHDASEDATNALADANAAMDVATAAPSKRRADTLYANAIIGSAQGGMVHVDDAWEADAVGLGVLGKSVQDGTPTPDVSVEIDVVDSPVSVRATGKNLLDVTSNQSSTSVNHSVVLIGKAPLKPNTKYTMSLVVDADSSVYVNDQITKAYTSISGTGARSSVTFETSASLDATKTSMAGPIGWYLLKAGTTGIAPNVRDVQLELGTTATAYEPYTSNQQTITLPSDHNYLASLPDGTRDELVLRADGVAVLTKRVDKVVVTGAYYLGTTGAGHKYVTTSPFPDSTGSSTITVSPMIYSDRYNYRLPAEANNNTAYRTWNSLIIIDDRFADLATARAILAAERPTVYYELATPATSYSADNGATWSTTDLAAGTSAIPLQKGTNYVWCTDPLSPEVGLEYVQDTNAVINEMRAAIVASGATS